MKHRIFILIMCSRLCSFEKCSSNPAVVCNCEAIPVLICQEHIKNHSQLQRSHTYTKVFSEIREEARKSAIKLFSKIKPELRKLRSNIIQEELSMIKEINKTSKNALVELKICEENLNQIILEISSLRFIDNSKSSTFVESLLKMQQQDIEKIKKIRGPKLSINSIDSNFFSKIFELETSPECFDYRQNYCDNPRVIKFIWGNSNKYIIGTFDAETLKVYQHKLEGDYFYQHGIKCLLPDGSILYALYENLMIIDSLGNIKPISTYKIKSMISPIYVGGCIFACTGYPKMGEIHYSKKRMKRINSSSSKSWAFPFLRFVSKLYILLGSNSESKIIYYDMLIDSFSEISSLNLKKSVTKTIVVQDRRVFIIEFSQFIYESTDNLIAWNIIGECSGLTARFSITSYPIFYKEKIYFAHTYKIYAFDIKEKVIKFMVNLDFSH
ncbi:unnamed protein product [Blepharisma stoltei]|uniref:Uncharacterized protein n=1 Tax=Blepharisma stoltei TaxID=1481888 RepID=A0AAU9IG78_9CILI|nr:unnamed protein product [Blepharisma stoltei]